MFDKKSLKIPKGNSDSINHIRTDNTTAKRKLTQHSLENYCKMQPSYDSDNVLVLIALH